MSFIIIPFVVFLITGFTSGNPQRHEGMDWRIVGGTNAKVGEFPYIASLRLAGSHTCGGSLIKSRWLLTAAHCVLGYPPTALTIVVGTNTLNSGGEAIQVVNTTVHPDFNGVLLNNDVAVVELARNVVESELVQLVDLICEDQDVPQDCVLAGWGRTSYPVGSVPNELQCLNLRSLSYNDCAAKLVSINAVFPTQICTLTKEGEGACHGDSGGPLVVRRENGRDGLRGLVSWGSPCAKGFPDVYTRVSSFCDWIEENTPNS